MPAGLTVLHAICDNGREVFSAKAPGQAIAELYTCPLADSFPGQGAGNVLYLNSKGDILWNDPVSEFWFEAFDLTSQVPEPANLFLQAQAHWQPLKPCVAACDSDNCRACSRYLSWEEET